jgi:hypothetical protein
MLSNQKSDSKGIYSIDGTFLYEENLLWGFLNVVCFLKQKIKPRSKEKKELTKATKWVGGSLLTVPPEFYIKFSQALGTHKVGRYYRKILKMRRGRPK